MILSSRRGRLAFLLAVLCAGAACGSADRAAEPGAPPRENAAGSTPRTAAPRPRIVALGDSLTAGLGLDPGDAFPALLQRRLDEAGLNYEVVNAGVSGDTSAGGLRRVDWALDGDVRALIVALGGNDALRGLPVDQLQQNLSAIVEHAQARNIKVVLAGMEAPPNYGAGYTTGFRDVYPAVAKRYGIALVPFLLEGVAGVSQMNQGDGIHPTAEGARRIADNVWAALEPIVRPHD